MTTKLEQAARQALEALEVSTDWDVGAKEKQLQSMKAITALREALSEQTEQEPVAWRCRYCKTDMPTEHASDCPIERFGLPNEYAAPVRTKDLTDEDLCKIGEAHALGMECEGYENNMLWYEVNPLPAFRAVIAKFKEKNK